MEAPGQLPSLPSPKSGAATDDYDQIQFVRDANQHHWLHDCNTLAMTQRDLNYLTKWVHDVKAAHPIRNNEEILKVPRLS